MSSVVGWIKKHSGIYPLLVMFKVLNVSKSGYYKSLTNSKSAQRIKRELIAEKIVKYYSDSKEIYGYRKVYEDIVDEDEVTCCKETVRKIMRVKGLYLKVKRKFKVITTESNHKYEVPENIIDRDFTATAPNQKWVSDITYVGTMEGWVYLAVILDLFLVN